MAVDLKPYDYPQVLRSVFEPEDNILRVKVISGGGGGGGELEVIITHTEDSIRLGDGTNFLTSTSTLGKVGLDVAIISSVLPLGAATEAKQDDEIAELQNIATILSSGASTQADLYDGSGNPITSTVTNTSKRGIDVIRLNSLVPREYDDIEITLKTTDGDPQIIIFRSNTSVVATLNITYDSDGDIERVQRV